MKLNLFSNQNSLKVVVLALAGLTIAAPKAHAVTAQLGDLILGVRDVATSGASANNVYLFDLGQPPPSTGTLVTNLAADLSATFGSDWYTDTNLKWAISGYDTSGNLDISKVETTYGTESAKYTDPNNASVNQVITKMNNVITEFNAGSDDGVTGFSNGGYSTKGGDGALKGDVNGYASYMPGYSVFSTPMEGTGFTNQALDLYNIAPGTSASNVVYQGTFTIDSSGDVSFSSSPPIVGVPEPSRAALLGLGVLGLLVRRRRSKLTAA